MGRPRRRAVFGPPAFFRGIVDDGIRPRTPAKASARALETALRLGLWPTPSARANLADGLRPGDMQASDCPNAKREPRSGRKRPSVHIRTWGWTALRAGLSAGGRLRGLHSLTLISPAKTERRADYGLHTGTGRVGYGHETGFQHVYPRMAYGLLTDFPRTCNGLVTDTPRTLYGPRAFAGRLSSGRVCVRQLFVLRSFVVRSLPVGRSSCVGSCGVRARRLTG